MTEQNSQSITKADMQPSLFPLEQETPPAQEPVQESTLTYLLAFGTIKGIGFKTVSALYDNGLLWDVWKANDEELRERWERLPGKLPKDLLKTILQNKQLHLDRGFAAAKKLNAQGIKLITTQDTAYPEALKRLSVPPRWIFVKGNADLLHSASIIAVVGTREPSGEGRQLARLCARELALRNFVVVSGLARGIDEAVHAATVEYFGQSVAVLGYGITAESALHDQELAARLIDTDGAIISEYLPDDTPSSDRFLRRNELIAALAKAVIPIETPSLESGTGSTIRRAMKLKTQVVGVIPAQVTSKTLIDTKANLVGLGLPVMTVMGNNSHEFWEVLRKIYPQHVWSQAPQEEQMRYFIKVARQVAAMKERLALTEDAIDALATEIKRQLK